MRRLRVGPLLLCTCVGLYRAVWLSRQLSGFSAPEAAYLLLADLPVLGALGILVWLEGLLPRGAKLLLPLLTIVLVGTYLADVAGVIALNARLQLEDVRRFSVEWWLLPGFLSIWTVAALGTIIASFFITVAVSQRVFRLVPLASIGVLLVPLAVSERSIPAHLQKYSRSVLLIGRELWGLRHEPTWRYTLGDFMAHREGYDALFDAPIAKSRKNIILVVVESLSAVDSFRTAGIDDRLPRFDELTREGMLFRNFFANFEASEGGIIALLSGVPPLHFPTASTDAFREYARQRAITATFSREGYRCEFLTNVPLQFISMDLYTKSSVVGFSYAGGQREIARYKGAPKFAFESPADHLLYEEVLARLEGGTGGGQQPVLLVAVTASSHPPFVDPLGRGDTDQNVWAYVQAELWWLFGELTKRRYFDDGLLLITGDHRKMVPVQASERERFGDSARARIPLVIIGQGVPKGVVDDRLFQQADLLRMLDRAIQPEFPLSQFVLWVERYMFVFGLASNASNLEVFEGHDYGRRGARLNLRGPDIAWKTPPSNAPEIERSIHRQRASQQVRRASTLREAGLHFGRDVSPSNASHGVLVGFSTDLNLGRDPEDPGGSLKLFSAESFDLNTVVERAGSWKGPFTMTARGFLAVPDDGEYWFSAFSNNESCLAIDKKIVLNCEPGLKEGMMLLTAGIHRFDLRVVHRSGNPILDFRWLPPGAKQFVDFPEDTLLLPQN